MSKYFKVKIPSNYRNVAISANNCLVADTNDSQNWDTIRVPLPDPPTNHKWSLIDNKDGHVTLRLFVIEQKKTALVSVCEHFSKHHYHQTVVTDARSTWKDCLLDVLGDNYKDRINDLSDEICEAQMEMWHSTQITFDVSFFVDVSLIV